MEKQYRNDLLIRAADGAKTERTPVWYMRQAGRTDPEYIALKEHCGLSLEEMFRDPEVAAEASLLPRRLGVDALIIFQDILTPLGPMGAEFVFRPGPVLKHPIESADDFERLELYDVDQELCFVRDTFQLCDEALDGEMPVLGFAGAPLTLAVFMLEGKSFGSHADTALEFLRLQPELLHRLLDKLTNLTVAYLEMQIDAGAAAVQLFESAAYLLSNDQYHDFALPYQKRIFAAMRGKAPTILFAREWDCVADLGDAAPDVVSLPSSVSIREARDILGDDFPVQGNLDNRLLAEGTWDAIEKAAVACVREGGHRGHIFNLSHGLLRETPYENIQRLTKLVHETSVE